MGYKVSIVIPIYKVEKYIHRCIDSILKQSYSNLEIILVDDGSPDKCGEIAEAYAKKDSRIIAVHKPNGGLSDARNFGMQYVTGEYTIFVDSDDWLGINMVETLLKQSIEYQADVVQSAFYYAYDDYLLYDNRYYEKVNPPVLLDKKTLMTELVINEKVKNFAWGKLYKTTLIKDLPFVKGVLFEDVFWAHKVMHRVNRYVMIHHPMYYYYQRDDSIVANYTPRNLDILKGLKERHAFIEKYYKDLIKESYKVMFKTGLIHYNLLLINRKKDKKGLHRKEILIEIKNNQQKYKEAVEYDQELKWQFKLFLFHPLINVAYLFLKKIFRKIKILPQPAGLQRINLSG